MSDDASNRTSGGFPRVTDPRVLLGLAVSALALWFSFRDVSFSAIWEAMRAADPWILLLPSVPCYVWSIYVRALRWRHLTEGLATIERGALFRATAVGFMVNNVMPLRLGEIVRAWVLSRDTGVPATALFGTVIVERVVDAVFVLLLAAFVLGTFGVQGLDTRAVLVTLGTIVTVPLVFIAVLRAAPERVLNLVTRITGAVLPAALATRVDGLVRGLADGLSGLRSGRSLAWVLFHSAVLWLPCSTIPFAATMLSLGVDVGGPFSLAQASLTVLVCVGAAVALPSAPGFVGLYHTAARFALQPFGVGPEAALAVGTLAHGVFWITITGLGLLMLRQRGGSLKEALASAESPS